MKGALEELYIGNFPYLKSLVCFKIHRVLLFSFLSLILVLKNNLSLSISV